jgi:hypothetical protein
VILNYFSYRVHLKYRTIGLGFEPLIETLPLAGKPYIEMVAVMARYNPFAEKELFRNEGYLTVHLFTELLDSLVQRFVLKLRRGRRRLSVT